MTIQKTVIFIVLIGLCTVFTAQAQEMQKPWEQYGLSKTEWKMIKDNKIPLKKVEELLKSGISISEYIDKPWVRFRLSENAYIDKRRSGLSAYDIELERTSDRGTWKNENKNTVRSEVSSSSGNRDLLLSFVLPGFEQFRIHHTWRGRIMSTIAVGSVAASIYLSIADRTVEATPIFVILVPDMFWSMLDFKFDRERNKE
jgi:hypothetical protein